MRFCRRRYLIQLPEPLRVEPGAKHPVWKTQSSVAVLILRCQMQSVTAPVYFCEYIWYKKPNGSKCADRIRPAANHQCGCMDQTAQGARFKPRERLLADIQ
jgi:hypothetical protein